MAFELQREVSNDSYDEFLKLFIALLSPCRLNGELGKYL
jgi:hypothetical protein